MIVIRLRLQNGGDKNKPEVYMAHPISGYEYYDFCGLLQADYLSRTDYGDFVDAKKFQTNFMKSFDNFFNLSEENSVDECKTALAKRNIEENPILNYELIVDKDLTDFDSFNDLIDYIDDYFVTFDIGYCSVIYLRTDGKKFTKELVDTIVYHEILAYGHHLVLD